MTTPVPTERDTRIDVLRALALLTIFVDHVPGTAFETLTYKNFGFSDAAEAFVLISGISVALAYGTKFRPGGRLLATLKMWRRAGVLYIAHIVTTMAVMAMFCAAAVFGRRPELLKLINIEPLMKDTPEVLVGIVTLGHQLGYNNILPVYAVLLLLAPAFLLFISYRPLAALTVSGLLWLVAGIWQIAPPNYPEPGLWFLNPLSWQFLFNIGLAAMLHVRRGGVVPVNRWLIGAAAAYVLAALAWVHSPLWGQVTWFDLPVVLTGFDKTFLSLPRLLHILAVSYLVVALPVVSNLFRTGPDHPLAILGKRSLPVFIAGTLIAMVAQVMKLINPGGLAYDSLLLAAGIAMQFALAFYLEWLSTIGGSGKARTTQKDAKPVQASFGISAVARANR
ncbi:OpgC family protein [Mesorhizobium sp. BR1-1-12]|uniref:OpgC family protein n=1 Tax=unclassified Mesorhizobium TaxID=325217 RepID=UPI001CC9AA36|nr:MULTISPECIES: OpgC family protein [unclassified Mesorhizobium]MBZ9917370.1 OpgC family protein [Mesorhizobium sp. BR1-1-7]MBZ9970940.1 OpgC family protein [Mesorhizobium sp. BR1-1-12]